MVAKDPIIIGSDCANRMMFSSENQSSKLRQPSTHYALLPTRKSEYPLFHFPSETAAKILEIRGAGGNVDRAQVGEPLSIRFDKEIDFQRGDWFVSDGSARMTQEVRAKVCILGKHSLKPGLRILLSYHHKEMFSEICDVTSEIDLVSLKRIPASELQLNSVGEVTLRLAEPVLVFNSQIFPTRLRGGILVHHDSLSTVGAAILEGL